MAPLKNVDLWICSCLCLWLCTQMVSGGNDTSAMADNAAASPEKPSVKKNDPKPPPETASEALQPLELHDADGDPPKVIEISEHTLLEIEAGKAKAATENQLTPVKENEQSQRKTTAAKAEKVRVEETNYRVKLTHTDPNDITESFKTGIYIVMGLSSAAVLFIIVKVYRLRLSRAERKYGVQGDRTTQELTPLPVSIEDGNSDDEDQTLFEINRQQIRIL